MRTDKIEGLKNLPEEDLTIQEQEEIAIHNDNKEIEQSGNADIDILLSVFAGLEDAPTIYDIEGWKDEYGQIHVSSILGEDDLYLWRSIKRQEYKQMLKSGVLGETSRAEEAIVRRCLLYPKPNDRFMSTSPAGVISTLKEQIMHRSGFVPDSFALSQIKVL